MDNLDTLVSILERNLVRNGVVPITNEYLIKALNLTRMQNEIYNDDNNMSIIPLDDFD